MSVARSASPAGTRESRGQCSPSPRPRSCGQAQVLQREGGRGTELGPERVAAATAAARANVYICNQAGPDAQTGDASNRGKEGAMLRT